MDPSFAPFQPTPLKHPEQIPSPALLIYEERMQHNIDHAVAMVGDPGRLRPHVKTHKAAQIVSRQRASGITKYKCATLREAEMLAENGIEDIVIAYPLVGPNIESYGRLKQRYPEIAMRPVVDRAEPLQQLSAALQRVGQRTEVLLDLDVGMHRTGIAPGEVALKLYGQIATSSTLEPGGLHVYDGHNHAPELDARTQACERILEQVERFKRQLLQVGLPVPRVVMGGTPTFSIYAQIPEVEPSPGTFVLHDFNYTTQFPDLGFIPAAFLLSRVISCPGKDRMTLDLGYKAISPDPPGQRGLLLGFEEAHPLRQNEEHWVFELPPGKQAFVGQEVLVCPAHICPTVALHEELWVIDREGNWVDTWPVDARGRRLQTIDFPSSRSSSAGVERSNSK